ncbi:glycoside hydrolase family 5 protein [Streptomyces sp. B22F1]|uniref:glycoside hydrolase family 5 protein n=1 Tax=Streptomyces sp. B22F1 TaxID=3153566 RepID=UPI00325D1CC4
MHRKARKLLLAFLAAVAVLVTVIAPGQATAGPAPEGAAPADAAPEAAVPWLKTEGNRIKDAAGNPVTLRGVSMIGPRHNNECSSCNPKPMAELINRATDPALGWHSKVIRLPVTEWAPDDSLSLEENFRQHIDPYVQQAVARGVYIIVDLHKVQDYGGTSGMPQQRVQDFWSYVAPKYKDIPNVIFEVYNEPINPDSWATWKSYIQPVVNRVRAAAPKNLILMGGPQWSTRVNQAAADPVSGGNIAYVYHLYPNQGAATAANLDAKFGNAAKKIPVILTEFGWNPEGPWSDPVTKGTTSGWGTPLRQYLDARPEISWVAWAYSNYWKPMMYDHDWNLLGGEHQGQFIKKWLAEKKTANQPAHG